MAVWTASASLRRGGKEQVGHHHPAARGKGGGLHLTHFAAFDSDDMGFGGAMRAGREREAGSGADAGEGLAAKAESGDLDKLVVSELAGGVALDGKRQFVSIHAHAVIGYFDTVDAAAGDGDGDAGGTGVQRVFDKLTGGGSGAFDDLAGGDAVDGAFGEKPDTAHQRVMSRRAAP